MIAAAETTPTAFLAQDPAFPAHDPIIGRIIGQSIRRRVSRGEIAIQDAGDLEQSLLLQLMRSWQAFDADRSHKYSYATTVVERTATNILRDRRAEKRNPTKRDRSPVQALAVVGDEQQVDLRLDVAAICESLPEDLCWLAEQLKTFSVSQVARDHGIPRTTLYRQVRKLREWFDDLAPAPLVSAEALS